MKYKAQSSRNYWWFLTLWKPGAIILLIQLLALEVGGINVNRDKKKNEKLRKGRSHKTLWLERTRPLVNTHVELVRKWKWIPPDCLTSLCTGRFHTWWQYFPVIFLPEQNSRPSHSVLWKLLNWCTMPVCLCRAPMGRVEGRGEQRALLQKRSPSMLPKLQARANNVLWPI